MGKAQHRSNVAEIERLLLAALCAPALDHKTRAEILEGLAAHAFAHPDHEVIFRALLKMPRATSEQIRETLSARLTRLGFPDIDVEPLFDLEAPSATEISALLRQLSC